jgi:hypothetical protein
MPGWRLGVGLVIGLLCSTSLASAILIDTGKGRVGGFLLNDDGAKLKISVPTPDGEEKVSEYLRAKITVLHQLDVKRLEGLAPDNPKAYRDYADELARQQDDPEARYVAQRLYLIAAKLAPAELGSSSLLRMSKLAHKPAEARKFRAMAFLLDPKADAATLKVEAPKPAPPVKLPARALEDFTRALRLYRTGKLHLAIETAQHDGVDRVFGQAPGKLNVAKFVQICTDAYCPTCRVDGTVVCPTCRGRGIIVNEFVQRVRCPTCKGNKRAPCPDCGGTHFRDPLPDEMVRVVLRCELWAMDQPGGGAHAGHKAAADTKSWSTIVQSRRLSPVLPLSLDTITHFDPNKNRYRNRKWVEE